MCVNACVRACVCGRFLTCKLMLVCLFRAVSPEGTERAFPSSWTPSDISPSNNGVFPTPFLIMPNLSFILETQRKKASSGLTGTDTLNTPHLFYLNFYLLLLLMKELCWPEMAELRGRKLSPNIVLINFSPFPCDG